jgi:hypothetical protein
LEGIFEPFLIYLNLFESSVNTSLNISYAISKVNVPKSKLKFWNVLNVLKFLLNVLNKGI